MPTRPAAALATAATSLAAAAAALALPLAAPAVAADEDPYVHLGYAADGMQPHRQSWTLGAVMYAPGGGAMSFAIRRCAPGAATCDEMVQTALGDRVSYAVPDKTPTGTSWEVTATAGDRSTTVRSEVFRGYDAPLAAPTVNGAPVAGGVVTMAPARWNDGGFMAYTRAMQLQACTNTAAVTCAVLASTAWTPTVPESAWTPAQLVVPERYAGWVLRAVDRLVPPRSLPPWVVEPAAPVEPRVPLERQSPWPAGGLTTASDFTAPVAPAPVVKPDPRPQPRPQPNRVRASIAGTLTLTGRRTLATVRCSLDCAVRVTVRSGRRSASVVVESPRRQSAGGRPAHEALRRLAARRLRVAIVVDGATIARGETTVAPRLLARLRG